MARLKKELSRMLLLVELSDEKGHSNQELAAKLKMYETRVSKLLGELESKEIIYHGYRKSRKQTAERKNERFLAESSG